MNNADLNDMLPDQNQVQNERLIQDNPIDLFQAL
jgi:hypothetical protein